MDDELLDLTEWNHDDLDFRTPELSTFGSRSASPAHPSQSQRNARRGLPLLQLHDWNPGLAYDESPPTCIHYSIEWKLQLNKGRLFKLTNDTEQNLVVAPGAFWNMTLKSRVEDLLKKKTPRDKCYGPEETIIVVSVTDRAERDLTKRFDKFDVDWQVVEDKLSAWGHLFRRGKKLRVDVSFICEEEFQQGSLRVRQNRGSATTQQLAQREELLETQEASGQPRVWKDVYDLMRCNGHLCQGTYCYRDEHRKHFKLDTSILTKLVEYAEEGNELRTHRDVPPYILDIIYEKDRLDSERRAKRKTPSLDSDRPIKIVNVLPSPYGQSLTEEHAQSALEPPAYMTSGRRPAACDLIISGPRDKALDNYTEWQCSQVDDLEWQDGFRLARNITKEDCLDLKHVYQDQDVAFYVNKGVKPGIARSFVGDIKIWADEA